MRHYLEYLVGRAVAAVAGRLPVSWSESIGAAAGRLAYRIGLRREVVESQLAASFPEHDAAWIQATARASFEHLGREAITIASLGRLGPAALRETVELGDGWEELIDAHSKGRGVVAVTGHFGNWEIGGAIVPAHGYPFDAVVQGIKNPWLHRYVSASRQRQGIRLVDRQGAWLQLRDQLRAGHVVGFVADQDAGRGGYFVPFFGRPAATHRAPALLALRGGAPLFVAGVRKTGPRRYRFWARRLEPRGTSMGERALDLTRRWVEELERRIRLSPEQYFWHHKRWKTRPPELVSSDLGAQEQRVS